jgi:hypothetical protein
MNWEGSGRGSGRIYVRRLHWPTRTKKRHEEKLSIAGLLAGIWTRDLSITKQSANDLIEMFGCCVQKPQK